MTGHNIEVRHLTHGKQGNKPNRIVVHAMGEYINDPSPVHAYDFLDKYGLSAHALATPGGKIIICRDDDEIAWHARGHNTNTLGIEFLVKGNHDYASFVDAIREPYITDHQWKSGIEAVRSWVDTYQISPDRVVRHSDISPGRKVDPGRGFLFSEFIEEVFD